MGVASRWLWCCMCHERAIPKSTCALCGTVTVILQHALPFSEFNFCHFFGSMDYFSTCLLHIPPIFPVPPHITPFPHIFPHSPPFPPIL